MQMTAPLAMASTEEKTLMTEIVKKEINRIQRSKRDQITATEEELKQLKHSRNQRNARDLAARKAAELARPCFVDRLCEGIVTAYAVIYGTIFTVAEKLVVVEDEK